jgi:hypothetical protein
MGERAARGTDPARRATNLGQLELRSPATSFAARQASADADAPACDLFASDEPSEGRDRGEVSRVHGETVVCWAAPAIAIERTVEASIASCLQPVAGTVWEPFAQRRCRLVEQFRAVGVSRPVDLTDPGDRAFAVGVIDAWTADAGMEELRPGIAELRDALRAA